MTKKERKQYEKLRKKEIKQSQVRRKEGGLKDAIKNRQNKKTKVAGTK